VNFVGSGVLAAVGYHLDQGEAPARASVRISSHAIAFISLSKALSGLDWMEFYRPNVTRNMGAAFMLYAQGLLPFLLPSA